METGNEPEDDGSMFKVKENVHLPMRCNATCWWTAVCSLIASHFSSQTESRLPWCPFAKYLVFNDRNSSPKPKIIFGEV